MNNNNKIGWCSGILLLVVLLWIGQTFIKVFFQSGVLGFIGFVLLITAIGFLVSWRRGEKATNNKEQLVRMAGQCDTLAAQLGKSTTNGLVLKNGEFLVGTLSQAGLLEFVSNGSSYSGMNNGVGLRITNGITWNVSGSSGQLTKNPEVEQVVDFGSVIFTNERVLFAGTKFTREWAFAKMVNVATSANGASVHMNVIGQSKVSGLSYTNAGELTPGILMSVAQTAAAEGQPVAVRLAQTYAKQFREIKA